MIELQKALDTVLDNTSLLGFEGVSLTRALNRVLAENITSRDNLPPFDKSAMDGYALNSAETKEGVSKFKITGSIKAGDFPKNGIKAGETVKIMTGAALPEGADAVIQIEKVKTCEDELEVCGKVNRGKNILREGEEIRKGDSVFGKGTFLRPSEIGMLASLGYSSIECYRKPKIIVITTGDELVGVDDEITGGKVRNCNEYALAALGNNLNADVKSYGVVEDNREKILNSVKNAFQEGDIVITSGGVSVGDYDFIEYVLHDIGADIKFTSVKIKPGKPITFATFKNKLFFGLPGNPLSVINTFEVFVTPAVKKMTGRKDILSEEFPVILEDDFRSKGDRDNYVYVNIEERDGKYYAHSVGSQSSNALFTLTRSNGVIIIKEGIKSVKAGDILNGKFIFK
ncbi:MAG TPA: molybdopterin molybdenumtransferase MoeA [Clostridium sp.]|uniref:Molybdopterin molybdenumtransferase n=1 Tax=Clostridium lapidicellarium TaxID=3240931 RepID=A0ABV4DYX8_9CLOT|nr:gephyrin-like molybdotransferase Glp [uncultured Clostridium sp.]NLU07321.1 molybdopterin molybdotransferase MoeA [Clostridiales bacterium]HBC98098.1 molybdopterin molybdenumtransferase MoeA [Clostridium sp.]